MGMPFHDQFIEKASESCPGTLNTMSMMANRTDREACKIGISPIEYGFLC